MGGSRGGLTTKVPRGRRRQRLLALKLTEGQWHDGRSAADMLDSLAAGQTLIADRACDSDALRRTLADRGAWANARTDARAHRLPIVHSPPLSKLG